MYSENIKIIKIDNILDRTQQPLSVSTALFLGGKYEIAVLKVDGEALEMTTCNTEECALRIHGEWVAKYAYNPDKPDEKPLTPRYIKLAEDLKKAAQAAREVGFGDDGGTCNKDCLELRLPRFSKKDTLRAIEAAGLRGRKTSQFGRALYLVSSPVSAQGNAETRQAEKMRDVMKEAGYDAGVWYQID